MTCFTSEDFLPLGFDSGVSGLLNDHYLPTLDDQSDGLDMMVAVPFDHNHVQRLAAMNTNSAVPCEAAGSPAEDFSSGSEGNYTVSPSAAAQWVYTPGSSQLSPFVPVLDEPECDVVATSPESDRSSGDDFVHVSQHVGDAGSVPRQALRFDPAPVQTASTTTSVESSAEPYQPMDGICWNSFDVSAGTGMPNFNSTSFDSNFLQFDGNVLAGVGNFGTTNFPFSSQRPLHTQGQLCDPSFGQFRIVHRSPAMNSRQPVPRGMALYGGGEQQHVNGANNLAAAQMLQNQQAQLLTSNVGLDTLPLAQHLQVSPRATGSSSTAQKLLHTPQSPNAIQSRLTLRTLAAPDLNAKPASSARSAASELDPADYASTFNGLYPAIRQANPFRSLATAQGTSQSHSVQKGPRGGRKKHTHLHEISRQRSHAMRKLGACWRCVMQRDPCDDRGEGQCCSRCAMRQQRGHAHFFGCDRSKLPEFVTEFLPPWLLQMHQEKSLEDTISREIVTWHTDNCIDVSLTCGYGPTLRWKLYEFTPKTDALMQQLQYWQDSQTGQMLSRMQYSPPYGMLRIDSEDTRNFEAFVENTLSPRYLDKLAGYCYAAENALDIQMFQCKVLDGLCQLYLSTTDTAMKPLLRDVLRLVVITYIMGHTLCITNNTLQPVLSNLRRAKPPHATQPFTSPRLANRQLKFFFSILRNSALEKILKWQQHTLHAAGKKDETWLPTFCVMLGLAIVLEEIQLLLMLNAEASFHRRDERSTNPETGLAEAQIHCSRIDARFNLLVGLFQCKYRDRKWSGERGSFGNGTPELSDGVSRQFLRDLRLLLEERERDLRLREKVEISVENQCLFTTRLTARFLLPFLNLPRS